MNVWNSAGCSSGPPPYASLLDYEPALSYEPEVYPYDHTGTPKAKGRCARASWGASTACSTRHTRFAGFLDTFAVLYPQMQRIDFRTEITRLEVPVYLCQGRHELPVRALLAEPAAARGAFGHPRRLTWLTGTGGARAEAHEGAVRHRSEPC